MFEEALTNIRASRGIKLLSLIVKLKALEMLAAEVYAASSEYFAGDSELASFLAELAEDESLRYHFMGSAADAMNEFEKPLRS